MDAETIELAVTALAFVASGALFLFARRRAAQPAEALKVRLVNYTMVQFVAIVLALLIAAHLLTLLTGHRFGGRSGGFGALETPVAERTEVV